MADAVEPQPDAVNASNLYAQRTDIAKHLLLYRFPFIRERNCEIIKRYSNLFQSERTLPCPKGCLQQRTQPRNEEDGGDELTFGHVVVLYAERLSQDERDGDDAAKRQDVMLGKQKQTLQEEHFFFPTHRNNFFSP